MDRPHCNQRSASEQGGLLRPCCPRRKLRLVAWQDLEWKRGWHLPEAPYRKEFSTSGFPGKPSVCLKRGSDIWGVGDPESSITQKRKRIHSYFLKVKVAQLCLTLRDPMDCSLPGSSVHGIFQARVLEWLAFPFSRGSS